METSRNITDQKSEKRPEMDKVQRVVRRKIDIFPSSIIWGVAAGILMGLYLMLLDIVGASENIYLIFLKYIFLVPILWWGLSRYRNYNLENSFFQKAILLGTLTSFFSSLTLFFMSLFVSLLNPEWSFGQYIFSDVNSPGDAITNAMTVSFEVTVLGGIAAFAIVQYLKGRDEDEVDKITYDNK